MNISLSNPVIAVENDAIYATLLSPEMAFPGILFVHGWGGSQAQDLERAREISGLGCVCLTADLRGHGQSAANGKNAPKMDTVTRAQNLDDIVAAYDWLAARSDVESSAIAVVGISYGGYLAALLSALRPIRWLALRAPALYRDEQWYHPKKSLNEDTSLLAYRSQHIEASRNRALQACANFTGDALIIESQNDSVIPHAVIENYVAALSNAHSLTVRVINNADHALTPPTAQQDYTRLLMNWLTEMITGARSSSLK